jgi:DNA helicase HerA-like ATPase
VSVDSTQVGTVISDEETPTFEIVRIKLKLGCDLKPGTLVQIPVKRNGETVVLVARTRSAHEHNPNERPEDINVRETLGLSANYPTEADSTVIYRMIEADLIEEIRDDELSAPQTLPASGAPAYLATEAEVVRALGLLGADDGPSLHIGRTTSGAPVEIRLRREAIQRHMFICGTTGSGKSYAVGVIAEELIAQGLPIIFLDTQNEYGSFVESNGGSVVTPGDDFTIRISSLAESELLAFCQRRRRNCSEMSSGSHLENSNLNDLREK